MSESSEFRLGRSVSIDQAADLLRVSRRTIYKRIEDGRLRTVRTMGSSQRVLVESLYGLGLEVPDRVTEQTPPAPPAVEAVEVHQERPSREQEDLPKGAGFLRNGDEPPPCPTCGGITIRAIGNSYKCVNCGEITVCS